MFFDVLPKVPVRKLFEWLPSENLHAVRITFIPNYSLSYMYRVNSKDGEKIQIPSTADFKI